MFCLCLINKCLWENTLLYLYSHFLLALQALQTCKPNLHVCLNIGVFVCRSFARHLQKHLSTKMNIEQNAEGKRAVFQSDVLCLSFLSSVDCLCVTWWRVLRVIVRRSLRLQSWQPTSRLAKSERLNNVNRLGWSGTKHIILKGEQQWNLGHTEEKAIIKQTQVYNNHD